MSSTACQDSGVVALRFFQLHSISVLLRLWMPWIKSAAVCAVSTAKFVRLVIPQLS